MAPTKGTEFIFYEETKPINNLYFDEVIPYEDWKYSKTMHFACGFIFFSVFQKIMKFFY